MKTIVKFGMATLTVGALLGATVLSKAETPDTFTRHGLPIRGVYCKSNESQKPASDFLSRMAAIRFGRS